VLYGTIESTAIPLFLQSRLYVDFRRPEDYQLGLMRLLSAFISPPSTGRNRLESTSLVSIQTINFLFRKNPHGFALELLVHNSGQMAGSIREVRIECSKSYDVSYYALPPTITFPVEMLLGLRTANERIIVGGTVGHEADEWKRPITGVIVLEPYLTFFFLTIPLYVAIAPQEEALIRIPFESCAPSNPTNRIREPSQSLIKRLMRISRHTRSQRERSRVHLDL
jgi:hypothetical protein